MECSFEQGPIRPPSEARSLLIRATRNCPWNKCAFCHTYRGTKFEMRSVKEIKGDIERVNAVADEIKALSWSLGEGGDVTGRVVSVVCGRGSNYTTSFKAVAAWLYHGGESVFLQDANSIIMKTADLVEIITSIRETFPRVARITSYCRSNTSARKSLEELESLKEAGLSRIHTGMESGYDPVLQLMRKGVTAEDHVRGGRKVREAGISLCEYIMPGLGGRQWSRQHAEETARVINQINPDFVRLRSLHVVKGTDLYDMMQEGTFDPLGDEEVLREIRWFIEALSGIETTIVSDHILNLLEELEGTLPEDKGKLLATIDRYFALPEEERLIYRMGRRTGLYRRMDDLSNMRVYMHLKSVVGEYGEGNADRLERDLFESMHNYI